MKYRIKVKTELSGKSYYYIQKRLLWFIWIYITPLIGYDLYTYIMFETLDEAKEYIQKRIDYDKSIEQQKIVKTKIINL